MISNIHKRCKRIRFIYNLICGLKLLTIVIKVTSNLLSITEVENKHFKGWKKKLGVGT